MLKNTAAFLTENMEKNVDKLENMMHSCVLCPRRCGVDRVAGERGFCGAAGELSVARAALHFWEEPCLSGTEGAGTVFFTGCNLRCVFCQNYEIAGGAHGAYVSVERLSEIFLELQEKGANNIDLVTPTHEVASIASALVMAKERGLSIPVVYNCGGYESVETLKLLEELVDIWMPDMKYADPALAAELSRAADYFPVACDALAEMVLQQPETVFDERGIMKKGVLVRHLVLPGHVKNSKAVLSYLWETCGDRIWLSLMSQYTPLRKFPEHPELERSVTKREYEKVVDFALELGFTKVYIQEGGVDKESFIPAFDLEGVLKPDLMQENCKG